MNWSVLVLLCSLLKRGIVLLSERTYFALWLIEQGILHLKRAYFALWLMERGIYVLYELLQP